MDVANGSTGRQRSKEWCFTIQLAPQYNMVDPLQDWSPALMEYTVYQVETAPTTGQHHIQGYIEFQTPLSFGTVKTLFPDGTHLEKRRGPRDKAREYCMKEESRVLGPWEKGIYYPRQGQRMMDRVINRVLELNRHL